MCNTSVLLPKLQQHINEGHPNDDPLEVQRKIILNQQLEIMQKDNNIRDVYVSGANIVYKAVFESSASDISESVLSNLIQNIRNLIDDQDIVGTSCQTLACVLYNTDQSGALCRKVIIENSGIKLLYDCLEKYITNRSVVWSVSTCLSNISVANLKGDDKSLVESRGINLLVTCLKNYTGHVTVESHICRTIRNHLQHEQVGCALVNSDGLGVILECNARNKLHIQLLAETWYALGNVMMLNNMAKQTIFDHGAVDRAQESMTHYIMSNEPPASAKTQAIADSVMWFLSKMICTCNRPNCQVKEVNGRIAHLPLMETVLQAMEKHPKSHKVQTRGAILIENMLNTVDWDNDNTHTYEDVLNDSKLTLEGLISVVPTLRPSSNSVKQMIRQIDQVLQKTWTTVKRRKIIQKPKS